MSNIILKNVNKVFENEFSLKIDYLNLSNNYIYYIIGENGSGKSVLLRILSLIESKYEGSINTDVNKEKILHLTTSDISFPYLTIKENIDLLENIYPFKIPSFKLESLIEKNQLERLSIDASLGMKSKVGLSLVLVENYWDMIVLDETISAIDKSSREFIFSELSQRASEGSIVIFTSHDNIETNTEKLTKIHIKNGEIYEKE